MPRKNPPLPEPRPCGVNGCLEYTDPRRLQARFCPRHANISSRYGSPTGGPPRDAELATYRAMIRAGLRRYAEAKPVRAALDVAREILDFEIPAGRAGVVGVAEEMQRLRHAGVTPADVLQRVAEVYALMLFADRFSDPRELDAYLARAVMKLARRYSPKRPTSHTRRTLAYRLKGSLQDFSLHLLLRLTRDEEAERQRRAALTAEFD